MNEGSSVFITEENINVLTSYYEDKIVDYLVVQQPKHGYIMFQQKPNNNVTIFTSMHLAQNKLKVGVFLKTSACAPSIQGLIIPLMEQKSSLKPSQDMKIKIS